MAELPAGRRTVSAVFDSRPWTHAQACPWIYWALTLSHFFSNGNIMFAQTFVHRCVVLTFCWTHFVCFILSQLFCPKACLWSFFNSPFFPPFPFVLVSFCPSSLLPVFLQAWTNVQTTMVAAPTSAGTEGLAMTATVPQGTNSWTKRLVEVKKMFCNNTASLMQKYITIVWAHLGLKWLGHLYCYLFSALFCSAVRDHGISSLIWSFIQWHEKRLSTDL